MLAPPGITVPPPGFGGIEAVIATLTDEVACRGHDVTLSNGARARHVI